jgi:hypothetical protein
LWSQIEDQVIALDGVRRPYTDAKLCSVACDRELGDSTFLIRRKHVVEASNGLGWAVSRLDTLRCNNIASTLERMSTRAALVAIALLLLGVAIVSPHSSSSKGPYHADIARSPGVLNPDVTQANISYTICVRGWTKTIRPPTSYTNDLKRKQMREYGVGGSLSDYQEDHLISLELGGHPTDARNLWPEPYPRASEVDSIENDLNAKVCSGELSLDAAQRRESELKHTDG